MVDDRILVGSFLPSKLFVPPCLPGRSWTSWGGGGCMHDKRLIEAFLPIQAIWKEGGREKFTRKGDKATL